MKSKNQDLSTLVRNVLNCHDEADISTPRDELRSAVKEIDESNRESALRQAAGDENEFKKLKIVFAW